jgi:hypothetical protein
MYYAQPAAAPPPGPPAAGGSVLAVVICLVVFTLGLIVVALWARHAGRRTLRTCPVCAAVAVRTSAAEALAGGLVLLRLQCGQCGTWRRSVATLAESQAHERAVGRDRRRIGDEETRLVRRRARRELEAFAHALRREVTGPDDFLIRARRHGPSLPRGQGLR